jgi:hypothetical protein
MSPFERMQAAVVDLINQNAELIKQVAALQAKIKETA